MSNSSINLSLGSIEGQNLGSGAGVFAQKISGNTLQFKSIAAGANIQLITGATEITISATTGGGGISAAVNGLNTDGTTVRLGGTLTGNTTITSSGFGILMGSGLATGDTSLAQGNSVNALGDFSNAQGSSTCAIGNGSHSEGFFTCAIGNGSHSEGSQTIASASTSHAEGQLTIAYGERSHAEGSNTCAVGDSSHAEGIRTISCGAGSHAQGIFTVAVGAYSFSSGIGCTTGGNKLIYSCGYGSFNHSSNIFTQTAGHGANADLSAILGGRNHNIETGNVRAAIIGGNGIKLTGTDYVDTTAVANFAIFDTPSAGGAEDVLTWNPTTKIINKVTQGSISDERLKDNLVPLTNVLDSIENLHVYEYEFNDKVEPESLIGVKKYGLLAQEVESEFPLVINDNLIFNGITYKTIDYKELVPILFRAIQELKDEINSINNKNN